MQIKYLKNAPLGQIGDVADVADSEAKILITLGFAEAVQDKPKRRPKATDTNTDTQLDA